VAEKGDSAQCREDTPQLVTGFEIGRRAQFKRAAMALSVAVHVSGPF
jgi:hypothetical protein